MPLDGISTKCLANELKKTLITSRIDKIYQPDKYDIHFTLRAKNENKRLLLSANPTSPRIHFTTVSRENPSRPPNFCMLLRKHLAGSRITNIHCPGYERIIEISTLSTDELGDKKEKKLIIEMMGRYSNIILLHESGVIIDSILHVDNQMSRVREVMPARIYSSPPLQEKYSADEAISILESNQLPVKESAFGRPVEKAVQESILGIAPLLSRDFCYSAGIDGRKGFSQLTATERESLRTVMIKILRNVTQNRFSPGVYRRDNTSPPYAFYALRLNDAGVFTPCATLSEALDQVYQQEDKQIDFEQKKKNLVQIASAALQYAVKKQAVHQDDIRASENAAIWQKYGQLILANHYMIQPGDTFCEVIDYESEDQTNTKIPLDDQKSASQNAQDYFKKYNKEKKRLQTALAFLEQDNEAVNYLSNLYEAAQNAEEKEDIESIADEMKINGLIELRDKKKIAAEKREKEINAKNPGKSKSGNAASRALRVAAKAALQRRSENKKQIKKNESSSTFRKFISSDGFTILCGRNNMQNDLLTLKTAAPDDLWFHAQKMPGTHVIIRCEKKQPPDRTISEAAGIAAFYSRSAAKAFRYQENVNEYSGLKLPVDYCPISNVKKPSGAKPGMVVYDHYNTLVAEILNPNHLSE